MKKLITTVLCFCTFGALAQERYKNNIKITASNFFVDPVKLKDLNLQSFDPTALTGIAYERVVYKTIRVGAAYNFWNGWLRESFQNPLWTFESVSSDTAKWVGSISERIAYKMLDVYGSKRYQMYRKHFIEGGIGATYVWGENYVIHDFEMYGEPPFMHGTKWAHNEPVDYWGVAPVFSYNYIFLRDRINVGLTFRYRYYFNSGNYGRDYDQYDAGFHLGVNF